MLMLYIGCNIKKYIGHAQMKVSLRKANALQSAITEASAGLDLATEIAINEFEKPTAKIAEAKERFVSQCLTRDALLVSVYQIRRAVAQANAKSGINDLLADVALVDKEIVFYSKLAKVGPAVETDVIVGKLGKIKSRTESDFYGREDSVRTSIFAEVEVAEFKAKLAALKKQKVVLQDHLLELNVATEIELSEQTKEILTDAGII